MKKESNQAPAFEARLNNIRVTIWRNEGEPNGGDKSGKPARVWFNTVLTRRYLDKKSQEFKDSQSLTGLADLALATEALRLARRFIVDQGFDETQEEASEM